MVGSTQVDKLAEASGMPVYKFRGDEEREFVSAEMNTQSFPTINLITAEGTAVKYVSEDRTVEAMTAFAPCPGSVTCHARAGGATLDG